MAHVKEDRVAVRDLKLDFYLGPTSPDRPGRRVPMPFTMLDGYQGEATHGFILRHPENYRELNPSFSRILGNENAKGMDIKGPCVIVLCNQRGIFVNATYEDIREETDREDIASESDKEGGEI
ncbi:hypothetical protein CC1G_14123 [Coprinopsis cinerea okayama7|uniref:Uncharacterized protein n=1 Tax=Coprinopsis cinerea (strain Okayama-7 / 130 / ATCC MYA-4618 / FGSC 9003) TaxID=240176 RepID=D6RL56_COPC7|nr:hypothetical protein CC1G_14123 [Coprinopsis cinerea okayama7\|eukprot:XP_002911590.1 hypothetical protein CC1G_14123 [Coprinopsis cinerea okayama7\